MQGQVLGTGDTMGSYFHIVDNLRARDKQLVSEKARWENFSLNSQIRALFLVNTHAWGFPGGAVVENLPANAGDTGSSPGLGRSHMPRSN